MSGVILRLPAPSLDPRIMEILSAIIRDRKIVGVLGIGGLVWSSTWIFTSLRTALNIVFQVEKGRTLLLGIAADFLMVVLAGFLLFLSLVFSSVLTLLETFSPFGFLDIGPFMQLILKYLLPFAFTFFMSFLIYKISPNKKSPLPARSPGRLFYKSAVGGSQAYLWLVCSALHKILHAVRFVEHPGHILLLDLLFRGHSASGR